MSLTPMSVDPAGDFCSVCRKTLTVNDGAIVYTGYTGKGTTKFTLGSCCVGKFMSSMIQDYAKMMQKYPYYTEQLLNEPAALRIRVACAYIIQKCGRWLDHLAFLEGRGPPPPSVAALIKEWEQQE